MFSFDHSHHCVTREELLLCPLAGQKSHHRLSNLLFNWSWYSWNPVLLQSEVLLSTCPLPLWYHPPPCPQVHPHISTSRPLFLLGVFPSSVYVWILAIIQGLSKMPLLPWCFSWSLQWDVLSPSPSWSFSPFPLWHFPHFILWLIHVFTHLTNFNLMSTIDQVLHLVLDSIGVNRVSAFFPLGTQTIEK